MSTTMSPPETRTILTGITWDTYKQILVDLGENRGKRLAYSEGVLEIMSPGSKHECSNRILDKMIHIICEETGREAKGLGSLTCNNEEFQKGIEPDTCYYFESACKLRAGEEIDLSIDPPPDLMIEIDITRNSIKKMPILLALGVPEWWRYDGIVMEIFALSGTSYEKRAASSFFPALDVAGAIPRFLKRREEIGDVALLREFRSWVRQSLGMK